MERNFSVDQNNGVIHEGVLFDLHNDYDFDKICIQPGRSVIMSFDPVVKFDMEGRLLSMVFFDVDYCELSDGLATRHVRLIDEIGFVGPDQKDDSWLYCEDQSESSYHLFFRLGDQCDFVRIHSRRAEFRVHDGRPLLDP